MRLIGTMVLGLAVVSMAVVLPGCGGASEADAAEAQVSRELSFVVVNHSRGDIRDIGLAGANFPMAFSPMPQGERSSLKSKNLKLPEKLTLHWSDGRGDRHEASVRVWSELGSSYSGPVVLTINQRNQVTLSGG